MWEAITIPFHIPHALSSHSLGGEPASEPEQHISFVGTQIPVLVGTDRIPSAHLGLLDSDNY